MAYYNSYNPYAFGNNYTPQQFNNFQGINNNLQQQNAISGIVKVNGLEGAKAYQLPPNSFMPLFDDTENILYIKSTDGAGYPKISTFELTEKANTSSGKINKEDFVTREEFNNLLEKVEKMKGNKNEPNKSSNKKQ